MTARRRRAARLEAGMIRGAFSAAIGAAALAAIAPVFLPKTAPDAAGPSSAPTAPAVEPPSESRPEERQKAGFREVSIAADPRGQYAADVLIDGSPVRMMVDTGATVVAVSASAAARIGLAPGGGPKWMIRTANGDSRASPVTLRTVSLGGLYMADVQALILAPEAGDVNLLGASFLRRLVSVEQRDGVLVLRQ
jgi:aspartyl protease family protein